MPIGEVAAMSTGTTATRVVAEADKTHIETRPGKLEAQLARERGTEREDLATKWLDQCFWHQIVKDRKLERMKSRCVLRK